MPTKKVKKDSNRCLSARNGKLPTQRDIADSFKGKKMTKTEREFVEASEKAMQAIQREKERGVI